MFLIQELLKNEDTPLYGLSSEKVGLPSSLVKDCDRLALMVECLSEKEAKVEIPEKIEIEQLIEAQKDTMISVATGGPRIQNKNDEYKQRRIQIIEKLRGIDKKDPNPFEDLWASSFTLH